MRIHTTAKLSEHMEMTPEGYLLCEGAALARVGAMAYLPEEVPEDITTGFGGQEIMIWRGEAEVFRPETLASFEGKPFTLDHPDEDVSPENWTELARGMVFHVRRGAGSAKDLMLADILITDAEAIAAVRGGMRELSCGYDADFEVIRPGVGRQVNIYGNHVALVDHGRAGARCKIKDSEDAMKKQDKGLLDKLRRLLRDEEAAEPEREPPAQDEEQPPVSATDDDVGAQLEEIKLMLRTLVEALRPQAAADEEPVGDEEAAKGEEPTEGGDPTEDEEPGAPAKGEDRKPTRPADADTVRAAQRMGLLGCRVGDSADAVRRGALTLACRDEGVRALVENITGKKPLHRVGTSEVRAAFAAVSALHATTNNSRVSDSLLSSRAGNGKKKAFTAADINRLNAEFYGAQAVRTK